MFSRVFDQRLSRAPESRRPRPASREWITLSSRKRPRRRVELPIDFCSILEALSHVASPDLAASARRSRLRGLLARFVSGAIDSCLNSPHAYRRETGWVKSLCESGIRDAGPTQTLEFVEMLSHVCVQALRVQTQGQRGEAAHQ